MFSLLLLCWLAPLAALSQQPPQAVPEPPNELTMQLIMSQRPERITEEQWARMMLDPVHISMYPIRITPAMLDTIDASQLDQRYQYVMVRE